MLNWKPISEYKEDYRTVLTARSGQPFPFAAHREPGTCSDNHRWFQRSGSDLSLTEIEKPTHFVESIEMPEAAKEHEECSTSIADFYVKKALQEGKTISIPSLDITIEPDFKHSIAEDEPVTFFVAGKEYKASDMEAAECMKAREDSYVKEHQSASALEATCMSTNQLLSIWNLTEVLEELEDVIVGNVSYEEAHLFLNFRRFGDLCSV